MVVSVGKQRGLRDSVTAARVSAITTGVLDEDVHCHCHCLLGRCSCSLVLVVEGQETGHWHAKGVDCLRYE